MNPMKSVKAALLIMLASVLALCDHLNPARNIGPASLHELARRPMTEDNSANVQLILMAVVAAIVLAVSIVIVYSVLGGIDYTTVDAALPGTPAANASAALQTNLATFYQVSPIYLVVLAAVGIISAIMMIVVSRRK